MSKKQSNDGLVAVSMFLALIFIILPILRFLVNNYGFWKAILIIPIPAAIILIGISKIYGK
jgi:hypothetical protein